MFAFSLKSVMISNYSTLVWIKKQNLPIICYGSSKEIMADFSINETNMDKLLFFGNYKYFKRWRFHNLSSNIIFNDFQPSNWEGLHIICYISSWSCKSLHIMNLKVQKFENYSKKETFINDCQIMFTIFNKYLQKWANVLHF